MRLWLVSAIGLSMMAVPVFAKNKLDVELSGFYERIRFARSATGTSFSFNSDSGYRARLSLDFYPATWLIWTLGGDYADFNYRGSSVRTIENPHGQEVAAESGFKLVAGDFTFYTLYQYRPSVIIEDITATDHKLNLISNGFAVGGMRFAAVSRYWDLAVEMKGGTAVMNPSFQGYPIRVNYTAQGQVTMTFGRKNKTLFEVISLKNIAVSELLSGLIVSLREDNYSHNSQSYVLSTLDGGIFIKGIF